MIEQTKLRMIDAQAGAEADVAATAEEVKAAKATLRILIDRGNKGLFDHGTWESASRALLTAETRHLRALKLAFIARKRIR